MREKKVNSGESRGQEDRAPTSTPTPTPVEVLGLVEVPQGSRGLLLSPTSPFPLPDLAPGRRGDRCCSLYITGHRGAQ